VQQARAIARSTRLVKRAPARHAGAMSTDGRPPTREERLAARLRENLRRRKAQARMLRREAPASANRQDGALPKAPEDG
jgi:hypothetical protein